MGGDADKNAGPLCTLVCTGYHDYTGGGQPLPPTVPPVHNDGYLAGAEQAASHHRSVSQGGGEKVTAGGEEELQ